MFYSHSLAVLVLVGAAALSPPIIDRDTLKLSFPQGGDRLPDDATARIQAYVQQMRDAGTPKQYVVAAWPDQDYLKAAGPLDQHAADLAKHRAEAVTKALKDAGAKPVNSYLMVSRPTWLQRTLGTEADKIKGTKDVIDHDDAIERIGQTLRARGGVGTVMIGAVFSNDTTETTAH